jgi:hypothetical protein
MDMTLQEEKLQKGSLLLAYMPNMNQISQIIQMGAATEEVSEEVMLTIRFEQIAVFHDDISYRNTPYVETYFVSLFRLWTFALMPVQKFIRC